MIFDSVIVMIDYAVPLRDRLQSRKTCGPYHWRAQERGQGRHHPGRSFYQASRSLAMDRHGSTFSLRLERANDHVSRGSRLRSIDGYYCDTFQDGTLQPIVARLSHGRGYLAGWTMGRGMIATLDGAIYETIEDAARAAHGEAESAAERERECEERENARLQQEEE